jgi:hypothetical protein
VVKYYCIFRGTPKFSVLEEKEVVQKLKWVYQARGVTPGRLYTVFLLIQKILKHQCGSRNISDIPSWTLVDEIRNKADRQEMRRRKSRVLQAPRFHLLDEKEYSTLENACVKWLDDAIDASEPVQRAWIRPYMSHLIVLTLLSVPPPRAQCFMLMKMDNLKWREELKSYEIIFDGHNPPLKNEKPIYLIVPPNVSFYYKMWLDIFRGYYANDECPYVFPNWKGTDKLRKITPLVQPLTLKYLGKCVPCSKFR